MRGDITQICAPVRLPADYPTVRSAPTPTEVERRGVRRRAGYHPARGSLRSCARINPGSRFEHLLGQGFVVTTVKFKSAVILLMSP